MLRPGLGMLMGIVGWAITTGCPIGYAETGPPVKAEVSAEDIQRLTIILDSYSYTPNHIAVVAGKPVELLLTSVTTLTPHNFVIHDSAGGVSVEQDVGPGKSVTVRFTPSQSGRTPFFCDKRLWPMASHREKGMEGILEVNPSR